MKKWRKIMWICNFFFVFFKYIEAALLGLVKYWTSVIHFIIYGFYPFYDV